MKTLLSAVLIAFIPTILFLLSNLISKKMTKNCKKASPYECGFQPIKKQRTNFNIRFFYIAIIFLVFDAEICLLIPTPLSIYSNHSFLILLTFIIIITMGTLFEWKKGLLSWMK